MIRKGVLFYLKPGKREEYLQRHQNVPDALLATLRRAGIFDYTIWNYGDMLFGCYQVADEAECDRILSECPVYQQWRKEMESIVYVTPETGQKEWMMDLMFELQ